MNIKKYSSNYLFSVVLISIMIFLISCSSSSKIDYSTKEAEIALNNGDSIDGKIVRITVDNLEPASAFGYNIQTGDHLNFVSTENPNVKKGDILNVKIEKVESTMGSFIITYKKVD